jgi:hypothetical protein
MDDKLLEQALIAARKLVMESGTAPEYMWHPDYGWLIVDGVATEAGARWYRDYFPEEEK